MEHSRSSEQSKSSEPPPIPAQAVRGQGRRRSSAILGESPVESPLTPSDQSLANLVARINREEAQRKRALFFESRGYSGNTSSLVTPDELVDRSRTPTQADYAPSASNNPTSIPSGSIETSQRIYQPAPRRASLASTSYQELAASSQSNWSQSYSIPGPSSSADPTPVSGPRRISRPPLPTIAERQLSPPRVFGLGRERERERVPGLPALDGHRISTGSPIPTRQRRVQSEALVSPLPARPIPNPVGHQVDAVTRLPRRPIPVRIGHFLDPPHCIPDTPYQISANTRTQQSGQNLLTQLRTLSTASSQARATGDSTSDQQVPSFLRFERLSIQPTPASPTNKTPQITVTEVETEAFPVFAEEDPFEHNPRNSSEESVQSTSSQDETETETSSLGRLVARNRARTSSISSDSSVATVFYSPVDPAAATAQNSCEESVQSTSSQDETETETSSLRRLVAQNRARASSISSDSSVTTVVCSPVNTATPTAPSTLGSSQEASDLTVPEHLRNPRVNTLQLPESYFKLLQEVSAQDSSSASLPGGDEEDLRDPTENSPTRRIKLKSPKPSISSDSPFDSPEKFNEIFTPVRAVPQDPLLKELLEARRLALSKSSSPTPVASDRRTPPSGSPSPRVYRGVSSSPIPPKPSPRAPNLHQWKKFSRAMNYSNYVDQPSGGAGTNPRQAPPSPSQGAQHTNGMNGGMGVGMVGYPTPAGHQSDLNMVMGLVDELSMMLQNNQRLTANVVDKMGRVRERAQTMNMSNDDIIQVVAAELNEDSKNLERENSELRKALEKSDYDKKENFKLACHGANILADITEKMHVYKQQHEADTLAWHRNYRQQLTEEREENLKLRNQINDMIASAARANGHLRDMRRYLTDHDELNELRIQNVALRQGRRFWKRMAMPLIPDDDSEWSDDDDLIDPEEKKRLAALEAEKKLKEKEDAEGGGESASA